MTTVLGRALLATALLTVGCTTNEDPPRLEQIKVFLQVTAPPSTGDRDPIYIAGDWQSWALEDPSLEFAAPTNAVPYTLPLTLNNGEPIAFKFFRGDWSRVETDADGFSIDDRRLTPTDAMHRQILDFEVAGWADRAVSGSTRVGRIDLWRPTAWPERRVWTYLPPGYAASDARYPVLFMFDGQNVFDRATSFAGEWGVDETVERLIASGEIAPMIVIAADNGGADRIDEYTPHRDPSFRDGQNGGGEAHLARLIDEVLAEARTRYRTLPGPEHTAIAGSSLGGLMSLYALYARPDIFGRAAALSASIWWADRWIIDYVESEPKPAGPLYIDMGGVESPGAIGDLRALADALRSDGFVEDQDLWVVESPSGQHNEASWRRRFPDVLKRLFPPSE